jgi:hypothetical protein
MSAIDMCKLHKYGEQELTFRVVSFFTVFASYVLIVRETKLLYTILGSTGMLLISKYVWNMWIFDQFEYTCVIVCFIVLEWLVLVVLERRGVIDIHGNRIYANELVCSARAVNRFMGNDTRVIRGPTQHRLEAEVGELLRENVHSNPAYKNDFSATHTRVFTNNTRARSLARARNRPDSPFLQIINE